MNLSRRFTLLALILTAGSICTCCDHNQAIAAAPAATAAPNPNELQNAYALGPSTQSQFAKDLNDRTYYVQLVATDLRTVKSEQCVSTSFVAWVRKYFNKGTKDISLSASITPPGDSARNMPLFEVSYDENSTPQACKTSISDMPLTPWYVGGSGSTFLLDVTAKTSSTANVSAVNTVVEAAGVVAAFSTGSGPLIAVLAADNSKVQSLQQGIDKSLSSNFSATNQHDYNFALSPVATGDDWSHHNDQATFATGSLAAGDMGVSVNPNLVPTSAIRLTYRTSLLGNGPGHYDSVDGILAARLSLSTSGTLLQIFTQGLSGFTLSQSQAITTAAAMSTFCNNNMRPVLASFLTDDDALAARYAILQRETQYFNSSALAAAPGCLSDQDAARLKQLNPDFTVPDNSPESPTNRSAFVQARGAAIVSALSGDQNKLNAALSAPGSFKFSISNVADIFPAAPTGQTWGAAAPGAASISQLLQAGGFRTGCFNAIPGQSLRNVIGMAMDKSTGKTAAVFIQFDSNYTPPAAIPPGPTPAATGTAATAAAATATDNGKIVSIGFYQVSDIVTLTGVTNWPDANSCPLT